MYLLLHQHEFIDKMFDALESKNIVITSGKSGCGKSFSFQWVYDNITYYGYEKALFFDGDYFDEEQDYYPFKKTLYLKEHTSTSYIKQGLIEASKDTPIIGNFASFLMSSFLKTNISNNIDMLNEDERIIVNYIKKILRNKKSCIICDNVHWWDRRSLSFLNCLIKNNLISQNTKFIISVTNNQDSTNNKLIKRLIDNADTDSIVEFPAFTYLHFKKYLLTETQHSLTEAQEELLYNLVDGHLKVFFEVTKEIKQNSFDFDATFENNKNYLMSLLNRRLEECGATGEQIAEVLEYASIIGLSFSEFELQRLTEYTKTRIKNIIQDAEQLKLTEKCYNIDEYRFAHDIIREIFKTRVDENHIEYYQKMSLCLKEIKPSQYYRRAKYMILSLNNEKAEILFCLEVIAQLRMYGNVPETLLDEANPIIGDTHKEYVAFMTKAYSAYHKKLYDLSLTFLSLILSHYSPELIAERDILKLRCYSKNLATDNVAEEIDRLNDKRALIQMNNEKEIYERYTHALITAYAHIGKLSKSRELEEEALMSLSSRIDFDENAKQRLFIIKRNANAIHEIDISFILVKQAKEFFEKKDKHGEYINIKQYYSSLVNYSAALIMKGEFSNAFNEAVKAFKLEQENSDIAFPRPQILRSNWILSGVLDGKILPTEAIQLYKELLIPLPGTLAEKLFYISNLSIMYAINNEPDIALKILTEESQKHDVDYDKEGIYKYRVKTNSAIYQYLTGKRQEAINTLKKQDCYLRHLINGSFFKKKNDIIIEVMNSSEICDGNNWLSCVHAKCPEFQGKPWRYFGKGYAFAALCDWGI